MARAGLNAEVLVAAALRFLDAEPERPLALAPLAAEFGVALPSLYKHVRGLDALRGLVAVHMVDTLAEALAAAVAEAGPAAPAPVGLAAIAHAYRGVARVHPGGYAFLLRAPGAGEDALQRAADRVLVPILGVLAAYGLTGAAAIDAARVVRSGLHGFTSLERAGGFGLPREVDRSFAVLVEALDAACARGATAAAVRDDDHRS